MRYLFTLLLILFTAPAMAEEYAAYAEQQTAAPQAAYPQQQVSGNYYVESRHASQPQPAYTSQPTYVQPQTQPGDYGHSIVTDIRQMNF